MQKMIDICYKYGNKYGITFNPIKTNWIYTNVCNNVSFDIWHSDIECWFKYKIFGC